MHVAHFYHLYATGDLWRDPLAEHLAALNDARFDGPMHVGMVGSPLQFVQVTLELDAIRDVTVVAAKTIGWEQVTIAKAHEYAQLHDGAVLYAHTKGAANPSRFQDAWRAHMTTLLVSKWQNARDALVSGHYDAVGCHWLTRDEFPGVIADTPLPMFGGNFWMATCDYLRQLPPCADSSRHEAEAWIGLRNPRVLDLSPGWPGTTPYPRRKMRRLIAGRT